MENKKEMTARTSSVGADERQSLNVSVNSIVQIYFITDFGNTMMVFFPVLMCV